MSDDNRSQGDAAPASSPTTEPTGDDTLSGTDPVASGTDALDVVLEQSRELGFLGPGPIGPQRDHARSFLAPLGDATRVLDLGSGGGLPGLVIAWELPSIELVLLDGMERRCQFLELAVDQLDLSDRVAVVCGRAEEMARSERLSSSFPTVVARSFGPPGVLAECAVGFLAGPGSRLLVSEPPSSAEDRWPVAGLAELGLGRGDVTRSHGGTIQELVVIERPSTKYPRRVGIPAKRPVF